MPRKNTTTLAPRPPQFDRFQTAVSGLGFVPSACGARFDPYGEPQRRPRRSAAEMERIERVSVPEA
ncbi:MAG: hypothetical protein ACRD1C_00045 [Terriglobales bacterium]